jgi:hypothetical protein
VAAIFVIELPEQRSVHTLYPIQQLIHVLLIRIDVLEPQPALLYLSDEVEHVGLAERNNPLCRPGCSRFSSRAAVEIPLAGLAASAIQ